MYPHHYQKSVIISSNLFEFENEESKTKRIKNDQELLNSILSNDDYKSFLTSWYSASLFKGSLNNTFIKEKVRSAEINDLERQKKLLITFSQGKQEDLTDWIKSQRENIIYLYGEHDEKYKEVGLRIKKINKSIQVHSVKDAYHNCHIGNQDFLIKCWTNSKKLYSDKETQPLTKLTIIYA